jgi:hypothetical protein
MQKVTVFPIAHVSKPRFVNIIALDAYTDEEVRPNDSYEEYVTSSAFGLSLNVASLLQREREMLLQQAFIENLCDSDAKKRVSKALSRDTRTYKNENMARRQIKLVVNGKMGPLPPPPTLVSLKRWQTLKLQLNPNKPQYCPSSQKDRCRFSQNEFHLEKNNSTSPDNLTFNTD